MAALSREQLLAVLRERYDYVPGAIAAAQSELKRRGVNAFEIAAAEDEGLAATPGAMQRSIQELTAGQKATWLLLPLLAISPIASSRYRLYSNGGYHRKSLQIMEYSFIGFLTYGLAGLVLLLLLR